MLAKTQKECKEKLAQAIEKNGKVDVVRSGKYTVAEWVRLWFETYSNSVRTIPISKQAVDLLILEHEKHPESP